MSFIKLTHVEKAYNSQQPILKNINMTIEKSEFFVLVGPSGSGKSTLLRLIAGLDKMTSGTIQMHGKTLDMASPQERNLSMVFQNYALYPHLTVEQNILFGLKRKGVHMQEQQKRLQESVELLKLTDYLHRKPKALSGGQRQRVALARAIVSQSPLCLMDEPLSHLDAQLRTQMRTEIKQLQKKLGLTTIYVTHDQTEAMTMGDRIMVLHNGCIQQIGTPLELYNQPRNLFVASFIGSPTINMATAVLEDSTLIIENQFKMKLPTDVYTRLPQHTPLTVCVRPEHLQKGDVLHLPIVNIEQLGHETHIIVRLADQTWTIKWSGQHSFKIGEILPLQPQHLLFFDAETEVLL
ncbi:ABC transporter ATP-binding protein [Lysinibacillus sp. NPDC092081]|uniref:ABC transporter ATP-binding protein n=1 Tax=Lysinibacillus sp. NPDC092081 TaxID=3364131 RepID=UPI00380212DC